MTRPVLPRTSSIGSGFFFCGIRLLPVETESSRSKKPNSSRHKMMTSSASRLTWTITSARRGGSDDTKSRSAPRPCCWRRCARSRDALRRNSTSMGNELPAIAPEPSGSASASRDTASKRSTSRRNAAACDRNQCAVEHRLGAPQVGVGRHQRVAGLLGLADERRDDAHDRRSDRGQPAPQVEPQVERDLLVARAAGVQALAGVADALDQLALDPGVDVLVVALRRTADRCARRRASAVRAPIDGRCSSAESTPAAASPRPTPGCR